MYVYTNFLTMLLVQLSKLLDRMNLHQYRDTFVSEVVDGELLQECDSDTLQYELGVTSQVHRAKLLRIIAGRQSIRDFIEVTK